VVSAWVEGDTGGEVTQTETTSCGRDPVESPLEDPLRPMVTPGLGGPSGSDLRVVSHGVNRVISRGIYSGLYCGGRSPDMSHCDTLVLAFFDGITRRAVAVDLHFFPGPHYGSI